MNATLLEGPAAEPVSLAEVKALLRLSSSDEDGLIGKLISAARLTIEAASGCELISQRWRVTLDCWPRDGIVRLPLKPIISCDAVRVWSDATANATLGADALYVDAFASPPRLVLLNAPPAPGRATSGIEIDLTVGFGAAAGDVPAGLRQAIALLAARWFERRGDDASEKGEQPLPPEVVALVAPYRSVRI
ncbi:head-tail connector protein [Terrarubrum flagellatum]|uniref:head-tail connector protein n=1 Tax=Terrirubrum flagellatum TaxID=2895980 RepID=UPI0031452D21